MTDKEEADRRRDAALVIAGEWDKLMAQCSPADLKPVRVRGKAKAAKRRAG
jgi:hypothetical protein